jgi:hypothetical protein
MQALMLTVFAVGVVGVALKLASGVASGMKRKLASLHDEDPIVNFFAWLDRVTTLHRP